MKKIILVFSALLAAGSQLYSADKALKRIWETSGFCNPESVILDSKNAHIYVSNVNGNPEEKDGNGFISILDTSGKTISLRWISGLNAPKGMALYGGRLYVTDIDRIAVIDAEKGKIIKFIPVAGAKFLNDAAADEKGAIYFSDTATCKIHRYADGKLTTIADGGAAFGSPNGLLAESGVLYVALFSKGTSGGSIKTLSLKDFRISDFPSSITGGLDGLAKDSKGNFIISDWVSGSIFKMKPNGDFAEIASLGQGSADIFTADGGKIIYVPAMVEGKVTCFEIK